MNDIGTIVLKSKKNEKYVIVPIAEGD